MRSVFDHTTRGGGEGGFAASEPGANSGFRTNRARSDGGIGSCWLNFAKTSGGSFKIDSTDESGDRS